MKKLYYTPLEIEIIEYSVEEGFAASKFYVYHEDEHGSKMYTGEDVTENTDGDGNYQTGALWDNWDL